MDLLTDKYYETVKDYLHPKIHSFVDYYRDGWIIDFPSYHGCDKVNKNETRKIITYEIGEQCITPTKKLCWKKNNNKNKHGITNRRRQYWTRYMTWTNQRFLFKNNGDFSLKIMATLFIIISLKSFNICQKH